MRRSDAGHRSSFERARRALGAQDGVALSGAILILLIATVLTAAAISLAVQTSTSTTRDDSVKAEVEAAEAGLHVAGYRLSELEPSEKQCVNENESVEPSETTCQDGGESLGNGASFQYWTTLPLAAGASCAGHVVVAEVGIVQRCVTADGLVNGVAPAVRLQARVSAPLLFPINGIFGLESVEISNNKTINAKIGTNGKVRLGNNASAEGIVLGASAPAGQPELGNGSSPGPVSRQSTNFKLAPVNTGATASENNDYRIENGLKVPKVEPYDESTNTTYAATRTVNVAGTLTLTGETYNFCNFTVGGAATVTLGPKVKKAKIYIDSPNDPGSGCKAGDGKFIVGIGANIVNPTKEASALQIFVYDGSGGTVEISNNVTFYGTIYAPGSAVVVHNNASLYGAIAAKTVSLTNNGASYHEAKVESLLGEPFHRAVWEQCTNGSGTGAGC